MGVKVIERHGSSLKDRLYIPAIAGGMKTTFKKFVTNLKDTSNLETLQYPEVQPTDITERYRGVHRLTKWDDGSEKCVACYMCATACPAQCIFIDAEERTDGVSEKRPKEFKIDLLECVFCGYCVDACPCDAIRMDTGIFSFTGDKREDFVVDKKRLMSHEAYTKEESDND
ncbi:NuoI/complex I 23 kDa subunit family protein [Candidatus Marinarcus aquaticus]|uniref:NADH-quinone oxidoreductase subunit I n=1 Tax=Candidatus Marinarcus aquaticus TaxID=2044504 RepID=A0A4Q0XPF0_9BACT|nr:NADH-quinone oxidoreductase subunit I [Candidatus Marinarcus aquaticus]RXJ56504.1 NADH-quinone oxidoreductase subunit I [Candidatus Marinarcus aquaticus]